MSIYQLEKVSYRYADKMVLSLPSLNIAQHKTTVLIGNNGAGKSTLCYLLAFLTMPTQGNLTFKQQAVKKSQLVKLRRRIGFLPQKPYMLRGSVLNNLQLALKIQGVAKQQWQNRLQTVLTLMDISHYLNQQATELSGGELQKVALARLLILNPEVLILDEPFSYLDQNSRHVLENFIQDYQQQGHTLIFSTHNRLQGLALADNVLSLVAGELVKTPLVNLFSGKVINDEFNTGSITIRLNAIYDKANHISIDPREIVLSQQPLISSMRNHYQGRIIAIVEETGQVRVTIQAGETFHALITYAALQELALQLTDNIWVYFKSHAVVVF